MTLAAGAAAGGPAYPATRAAPSAAAAAGARREPSAATGSNAERAATLIRGLEASAAGDSSVIAEIYTDEVEGWSPSVRVSSAAELAIEIEDRDEAFSDIELAFAPVDVAGDQACVEWTMFATHSGPLSVNDDDVCIDATGARLTLHGITVAEFDGDRIRSFRQYWDEAELLAQIGILADD
jgi:hypothetical protein